MKNALVYEPQPNPTPEEVMEVLKVFTVATMPPEYRTHDFMMGIYKSLPLNAQRHFKIVEKTS
jgi:hypothetical protein